MAFRQILYHVVFRTKFNVKAINVAHEHELYSYIWGTVKNQSGHLYRINGTEDHLHLLTDLHPSICLADFVKTIKVASSKWMKLSGKFPAFEGWASQYCAITCSIKERDVIIEYIKNQKSHHKTEAFKDEMDRILMENGIAVSSEWYWKD